MFSLTEDALIVTDDSGNVYQLSHASDGKGHSCHQLPSSHQPGRRMYLFRLHGMMSPKGSISSIGNHTTHVSTKWYNNDDIYVVLGVRSFPCVVLLGLRAGYKMFQAAHDHCPSLYFTTWTLTDK